MAKTELQRHKVSDAVKWVITLLVALALIGGMVTLFVKLDRQTGTTRIGGEAYSIGTISDTGEYVQGDTAIYTRSAVNADGLKVTMQDKATVTYKLFFYDKDGKFISATEALSADFDGNVPTTAKLVKVMITPTEDKDGKVSATEVLGYAKQVTVTVNR